VKRIQFFVDDDVFNEIKQYAEERGFTTDNMIRYALYMYMRRKYQKTVKKDRLKYRGDMENPGGVYFVTLEINGKKYCKIGISSNIKKRIKGIEVGLPIDAQIFKVIQVGNMYKAERAFHDHFASKRIKREWFELSDDDYKKIETYGLNLIKK